MGKLITIFIALTLLTSCDFGDNHSKPTLNPENILIEQEMQQSFVEEDNLIIDMENIPEEDKFYYEDFFGQPSVENIQQALFNANFYNGKIDGILGPRTKRAIIDFQKGNDLSCDGKVGPETWKHLSVYLSINIKK
ncbi:MAG: peptidoglycan-binding protein [Candidatus Gygaella obscura]|nr:peptidoglycan-binding protein [Candidatus Gygaella obscura]